MLQSPRAPIDALNRRKESLADDNTATLSSQRAELPENHPSGPILCGAARNLSVADDNGNTQVIPRVQAGETNRCAITKVNPSGTTFASLTMNLFGLR